MSDKQNAGPLDRIRAIAMLLPGAHDSSADEATVFTVDGQPFAKVDRTGQCLTLRAADGEEVWTDIALDEATDWTLIEDRVARSWELSAPAGLLEAGGR